jgi:hypothetical protein
MLSQTDTTVLCIIEVAQLFCFFQLFMCHSGYRWPFALMYRI